MLIFNEEIKAELEKKLNSPEMEALALLICIEMAQKYRHGIVLKMAVALEMIKGIIKSAPDSGRAEYFKTKVLEVLSDTENRKD